ncbi:unnamed protein product, partial [marine sediment metagenome]
MNVNKWFNLSEFGNDYDDWSDNDFPDDWNDEGADIEYLDDDDDNELPNDWDDVLNRESGEEKANEIENNRNDKLNGEVEEGEEEGYLKKTEEEIYK